MSTYFPWFLHIAFQFYPTCFLSFYSVHVLANILLHVLANILLHLLANIYDCYFVGYFKICRYLFGLLSTISCQCNIHVCIKKGDFFFMACESKHLNLAEFESVFQFTLVVLIILHINIYYYW